MNRDDSNVLGFFKTKLNELCIRENRSYTEEEIKFLEKLEDLMKFKEQRDRLAIQNGELCVKVCNLEKDLEEYKLEVEQLKSKKISLQRSKTRLEKKYILLRHDYRLLKKKEFLQRNED